ncbi:helix-turn-helix domain-containing protein [Serratia sp. (in: enterobacteria)]|uniref:helix-turn-helix domain-containing protein n=1 Tax=Serratia sp. (in: enterobacteria) TaxID=616 RepID=UPI00398A2D53
MQAMIECIKMQVKPVRVPPGKLLLGKVGNEYQCYFIDSGLAVVYSDTNPKPLCMIKGSHLFGLSKILCPKGGYSIKIIHASDVYAIPAGELLTIIEENNQWQSLASCLSDFVHVISNRNDKERKSHTATLILQTLEMLQNESEEVRLAHTVNDYVGAITGLSHSTVIRGIDGLKKQGSIDIKNGLLLRFERR